MSEHTHNCNCGCGCENTAGHPNDAAADEDDEPYYITLTLDDGTELECMVVGFFEAKGNDYIALLPTEGQEAEDGEVFLYRYSETDDEDPILDVIEDDDEYMAVSDAFDAFLDKLELDEIVEGEE